MGTPHDTIKIGEDKVVDLLVEQVEMLKESISFNQDNLKALAIMDSSEISYDFEIKPEAPDVKEPLVDRLDTYYEPESTSDMVVTSSFPPSFQPVAMKPVFYDLAFDSISYPSLEDKISSPKKPGVTGGFTSWLGWNWNKK